MTTDTYSIARDGLADLALPLDLEQRLRDALAGPTGGTIGATIENAVDFLLAQSGWDGNWSARRVVESILDHFAAAFADEDEAEVESVKEFYR